MYIRRNHHMGSRICGDAYILRLNEPQCQPEIATEENRFRSMSYEDVPSELTNDHLLREMMATTEWKVLPYGGNVVRLGLEKELLKDNKKLKDKEVKLEKQRDRREKAKMKRDEERAERARMEITEGQEIRTSGRAKGRRGKAKEKET